jgi:hypothetical protein
MSGDIEDFLKRAAQRRQARQAGAPVPGPEPAPSRPEYTNARRERQVRPAQENDDELVVAEVIQQPLAQRIEELKRSQAAAQEIRQDARQGTAARRDTATAKTEAARQARVAAQTPLPAARPPQGITANSTSAERQAASASHPDVLIDELLKSLSSPGGLRKAILLHEILDRPEHRW